MSFKLKGCERYMEKDVGYEFPVDEAFKADDLKKRVPIESFYEVEIPDEVLKKLNIKPGENIKFVEENDRVYIEKATHEVKHQ